MSPLPRYRDGRRQRSHFILPWAPLPLVGFLLGATGCGDRIHVATMPSVAPWVVPELHDRLDDAGRFAVDWRTPPDSIRFVSPEEAVSFATVRIHRVEGYEDSPRSFHGNRFSVYETEHGDLIDFRSLRPGPNIYFVESPYGSPPDTLPTIVQEARGPQYVIPYFNRRGYQVMVAAVPALEYRHRREAEGWPPEQPGVDGLDMTIQAIPAGAEYQFPLTPECAVRLVAEATGRRIVELPRPVLRGRRWSPVIMFWRLRLDDAVAVRVGEGGDTARTDVLYLGMEMRAGVGPGREAEPGLYRAAPVQPAADSLMVPADPYGRSLPRRLPPGGVRSLVAARPMRSVRLPVLPGEAIDFERVELVRGSIDHRGPERHFPCQRPLETSGVRNIE